MEAKWYVVFLSPIDTSTNCEYRPELLNPASILRAPETKEETSNAPAPPSRGDQFQMTEEEERELAELLDSD
jgi:hypothetical protein